MVQGWKRKDVGGGRGRMVIIEWRKGVEPAVRRRKIRKQGRTGEVAGWSYHYLCFK